MKRQEIERIKLVSNNMDINFKLKRKAAGVKLLKRFITGGLILFCWTLSMLLVIIIVSDPPKGIMVFLEVNTLLYQLYFILCGIGIFIFLIDYVLNKKKHCVHKIIIESPSNNKYK